ncbi:MAG: zinc-ribbon domain-containing protein [bacterium]|nr:zinc-ribbon domain-containing protein [bacterium]
MFCPDCGREAIDRDMFCPICGYPIDLLAQKIEREKIEVLGWAERIVGKPKIKETPQPEQSVISFVTGPHVPTDESEKKGMFCERCGSKIDIGVMCSACGDRLPFHSDSDPFLGASFRGLMKMIFAPRSFAINFPYPVYGGITQPILYSGVLASLFILSLPLTHYNLLLRPGNNAPIIIPAVVGFILSMILVPVLVYLSAGLIHTFATILGGKCQFRRTVRVFAAGIFWLFLLGLLNNLTMLGFFYLKPLLLDFLSGNTNGSLAYEILSSRGSSNQLLLPISMFEFWRIILLTHIIGIGWLFGWAYGSLYRLRWWNSIILTLIIYFPFIMPTWLFLLLYLPLKASGFLP